MVGEAGARVSLWLWPGFIPKAASGQTLDAPTATLRFLAVAPSFTLGSAPLNAPTATLRMLAVAPSFSLGPVELDAPVATLRFLAVSPTLQEGGGGPAPATNEVTRRWRRRRGYTP